VVRFVAERVAEHLPDTRELVLPVEREHHAEEAVELGALHALAEDEDVLRQQLLVFGLREVEVATKVAGGLGDELVLPDDRRHVLEHRLALVRIDLQRGDHVEQRVGVDVLLVGMAAQHQLQLGRRHQLADDVLDVVADDALGRGEVADPHPDDPALHLAKPPSRRATARCPCPSGCPPAPSGWPSSSGTGRRPTGISAGGG
jgi:hypothetical protein